MINLSVFMLQGSLFTAINNIEPMPFANKSLLMDKMLVINDGDKLVYNKLVGFTVDELAEMILLKYGEHWKQVILVNGLDFSVGTRDGREMVETITDTRTRENTNANLNKVSAYDSDDLVTNDGTDSTGNENESGTRTRTVIDSTGDIYTAYKHLSMQAKNNIIEIVLGDVGEYLTLSIY